MQEATAMDFYKKVVEGTEHSKTITLEAEEIKLAGVEQHIVDKKTLGAVIERLPDEMFEVPEDLDEEDLENMTEEEIAEANDDGGAAISEATVAAFEELCVKSLEHSDLTDKRMAGIIGEFSFEVLFELGTEILEFSIENTGDVQDFHVQE